MTNQSNNFQNQQNPNIISQSYYHTYEQSECNQNGYVCGDNSHDFSTTQNDGEKRPVFYNFINLELHVFIM